MNTASVKDKVKRGPAHEGPRNHLITFAISIFLTFIAFMAVANPALGSGTVIFLLVSMAIVQAYVQLVFWMHLKDRGHFYPRLFFGVGGLVAFLSFLYATYWTWW